MRHTLRYPLRTVSLLLSLVLLLTLIPFSVYAAESGFAVSSVHTNPNYVASAEEQTSEVQLGYEAAAPASALEYVYSVEDAAAILRNGMKNRQAEITLNLSTVCIL